MKQYECPRLFLKELKPENKIASLNDWLSTNGLERAGITTYLVRS